MAGKVTGVSSRTILAAGVQAMGRIVFTCLVLLATCLTYLASVHAASATDALDVGFSGTLTTSAYTTTEGEVMRGTLRKTTDAVTQISGGVRLPGGTGGLRFDASNLTLGTSYADQPFLAEVQFTPTANAANMATLFAAGGNFFVRAKGSSLEYGFASDQSGSWVEFSKSVPYPSLNQRHAFSLQYVPTANGTTLYAILDGVELDPVVSDKRAAINGTLSNAFGFGADVHPAAASRGFVGDVHRVRLAAIDGFSATAYRLQPNPITSNLLVAGFDGTVSGTVYSPAASESVSGQLKRRAGSEDVSASKATLSGGTQAVDFVPALASLTGVDGRLSTPFVAEMTFTPTGSQAEMGTLFAVGGNLFVRQRGSSLEYGFTYLNGSTYVDVKQSIPQPAADQPHNLSVVYEQTDAGYRMQIELDGRLGEPVVAPQPSAVSANESRVAFGNEVHPQALSRGYRASMDRIRVALLNTAYTHVDQIFDFQDVIAATCDPVTASPGRNIAVVANECDQNVVARAGLVRPNVAQWEWQNERQSAFLHFGINTFYNQEWGHGNEDPARFNPTQEIDTDSWMKALRDAGYRRAILTVKHHDGFLLYPSRYSSFDVASTPWKNGAGDLVRDFTRSAARYGLRVGLYLSPADSYQEREGLFGNGSARTARTIPTLVSGDDRAANPPRSFTYSATDYGAYFLNTLYEILTQYGPIQEVWFDGASGNTAAGEAFDYDAYYDLIKQLQPGAIVAVGGNDVRWVGNESGDARISEWSPLPVAERTPGRYTLTVSETASNLGNRQALLDAVKTGGAQMFDWRPAEADFKLTGGWFAHPNDTPKSGSNQLRMYELNVGRNAVWLMNVPPTTTGNFAPSSIQALKDFYVEFRKAFGINRALAKAATVASVGTAAITDDNPLTGVEVTGPVEIDLGAATKVDRIWLNEDTLNHGQTIEGFTLEALVNGAWLSVGNASEMTTVGADRIISFPAVQATKVRVTVTASRNKAYLAGVSVYGSTAAAPAVQKNFYIDCAASNAGDGSGSRPFNSLEQFRQVDIVPGSTVSFKSGTACPVWTGRFWGYGTNLEPVVATIYGGSAAPTIGGQPARQVLQSLGSQGWQLDGLAGE